MYFVVIVHLVVFNILRPVHYGTGRKVEFIKKIRNYLLRCNQARNLCASFHNQNNF